MRGHIAARLYQGGRQEQFSSASAMRNLQTHAEDILNTLAYLVYGSRREFQLELTYSILSAVHHRKVDDVDFRIVLVTDASNRRHDLPVEHLVFNAAELADWTRGGQYHHEAKIHALGRALDVYGGKVALVDTDTFFNFSPARLFERIGPQRSLMHACEGALGNDRLLGPILERFGSESSRYQLTPATRLFNSGVIGLDYGDRPLLVDTLVLLNQLYAVYPAFNIEQFALSIVLDRQTSLRDCQDLVTHYYGYSRGFIRAQVADLFPEFSAERFWRHAGVLPKIERYPGKRKLDLVKARIHSMLRHQPSDYRFAYLACLSTRSSAAHSPAYANVWARVAVDILRQNEFRIVDVEQDFAAMKRLTASAWADEETREAWQSFWDEVAEARRRGQTRTTATAWMVSELQANDAHAGRWRGAVTY
jgi:hypothetical protein